VRNLLSEIADQIRVAKKAKDEKTLKELVGSFTSFLETLQKDIDPKKMPVSELRIMAEAFSSLDQHDKAAELLSQYPVTPLLDSKKEIKDMSEKEQRELADYWSFQWELSKEYRKAGKYTEALKVVNHWLNHPKALFKMPQAYMEKNFILEDDGKYGNATMGWTKLSKSLMPKVPNDNKMKQLYFDGFFYGTRTLFYYGLKDPAVKSKEKIIDAAGKRILDLEFSKNKEGWEAVGPRFEQLLATEPVLKEAYDRQKAKRQQ
jgi:tetratricopeptide (TPR) repeat protein